MKISKYRDKINGDQFYPAGDVLWILVESGNVVP